MKIRQPRNMFEKDLQNQLNYLSQNGGMATGHQRFGNETSLYEGKRKEWNVTSALVGCMPKEQMDRLGSPLADLFQ